MKGEGFGLNKILGADSHVHGDPFVCSNIYSHLTPGLLYVPYFIINKSETKRRSPQMMEWNYVASYVISPNISNVIQT
uniref:Uncharacterized protein n=1 Tax=Arundo donax TaxID=35708 RepID=A0A0A9DXA3_ARUDO